MIKISSKFDFLVAKSTYISNRNKISGSKLKAINFKNLNISGGDSQ